MAEPATRLLLRVTVKLMALFAIAIALYPLLSSVGGDDNDTPSVKPALVRLDELPMDQAVRIPWGGGNLILVKRTEATLNSLVSDTEILRDPASAQSPLPAGLSVSTRSRHPALFVAFDRGTDMGCPLQWFPSGSREAPQQPWHGGFRDSCRGSWYDAAGRVLKAQQAGRNLDIPPHRYRGEDLLEIGLSGDNAAPAN